MQYLMEYATAINYLDVLDQHPLKFSFKVSDSCPVTTPKDHLLLSVGSAVYKVCPNPDALWPYLIKDNPAMPVVCNHKIKIDVNTAGQSLFLVTNMWTIDESNLHTIYVHLLSNISNLDNDPLYVTVMFVLDVT